MKHEHRICFTFTSSNHDTPSAFERRGTGYYFLIK